MSPIDLGMPVHGLSRVPRIPEDAPPLKRKDFVSDQEVRWCPGCGDYSILATFQSVLPELGIPRENVVVVSGIGCSSRFPYYVDTYGMHSIHGRAPAIATGLATAREDLSVWVVTGDGDALSIGGNHLIHTLRRNVNLKILMFNNRIYGLTKGQYSPTSPEGLVTKSSPAGALDAPFNPVALALGAGGTFVARTMASDREHLSGVLREAAEHRGTAFVEIYQNCPIFNDGAFDTLRDANQSEARLLRMVEGEPLRVGDRGVQPDGRGGLYLTEVVDDGAVLPHDPSMADSSRAFALAGLDDADMSCVPVGVFRKVSRTAYDDQVRAQVAQAMGDSLSRTDEEMEQMFAGNDPWIVE
ncbi:2-oxoglutarate ferredoxin oxidoreductase subunit beta [Austwickia chelonae]|uniref:Putative 2-oxoglutarate ferredoxin oxidoreductase beta subunit n=1 Tax=Austwickia chelonae NBRC 105200 TaxID=1184607 RepID=K6V779_9MICO|nr:2-oxoacid:ferredoxin oxidoreductase subunit beta [Austwickia chelonae]GAB78063.1 putative 2-oxoglutarate ferredoxin oxidoreductase beta subunit [Austwickia chelonae NBRC 105200]SEV95491.1 2-oxoglutarate ferredoxin oxidoreductase subunit beta [Austwickia chelonae]